MKNIALDSVTRKRIGGGATVWHQLFATDLAIHIWIFSFRIGFKEMLFP